MGDTIRVEGRVTTVGRFLVAQCLPPGYRADVEGRALTASRLRNLLSRVTRDHHVEIAARAAEALEQLGRAVAGRSGFSLARRDFQGPSQKDAIVAAAKRLVHHAMGESHAGRITDFERYRKTVDVWCAAIDQVRAAARAEAPQQDPLAAVAAARPDSSPPESLRTMDGLLNRGPWECEWESPVLHTRLEGLTPHEYMMTCHASRRAFLEQRTRDDVAATLLHDLHAVMGETVVTARDCGTQRGVVVSRLEPTGESVFVTLAARIEGRVTARAVVSTDGTVIAGSRTLITRSAAERIDATQTTGVVLLDPMTCEADGGVCAACFGLDPDDATWPVVGDEVGARAAVTIAAAARTMTTHHFHIC